MLVLENTLHTRKLKTKKALQWPVIARRTTYLYTDYMYRDGITAQCTDWFTTVMTQNRQFTWKVHAPPWRGAKPTHTNSSSRYQEARPAPEKGGRLGIFFPKFKHTERTDDRQPQRRDFQQVQYVPGDSGVRAVLFVVCSARGWVCLL